MFTSYFSSDITLHVFASLHWLSILYAITHNNNCSHSLKCEHLHCLQPEVTDDDTKLPGEMEETADEGAAAETVAAGNLASLKCFVSWFLKLISVVTSRLCQ